MVCGYRSNRLLYLSPFEYPACNGRAQWLALRSRCLNVRLEEVEMAAGTRKPHERLLAPNHVIGVGHIRVLLPFLARAPPTRGADSVRRKQQLERARAYRQPSSQKLVPWYCCYVETLCKVLLRMCAYKHIYTYTYIHIYIYTYTHTHTHTHTHKHTQTHTHTQTHIYMPMKTGVPRMMHSDTPTMRSDRPWIAASKR